MNRESRRGGVGAVVIARNEGDRLMACLDSLDAEVACVVYADSESSDGSPERARARGLEVVELGGTRPLNAARGRNAGFKRLMELHPDLEFVFFVDGDCRLVPGFVAAARAELERDSTLGAVCGRRQEIAPEVSLYNRVVDCEWNTPVGPAEAFGGDVLVRVRALKAVGGYRESMNQGEDPELSFRLRRSGFGIQRIEHDMTWHDVALHRFSAWRRRHERGGYAYAHGALLHWREPGRHSQRALLSILAWGVLLPLAVGLAWVPTHGASCALLGGYAVLGWRIRAYRLGCGDAPRQATRYAALISMGKLVEAVGVLRCLWALATGAEALTVEYKNPAPSKGDPARGRAA